MPRLSLYWYVFGYGMSTTVKMHRQYFSVFKLSKNVGILVNNHSLASKGLKPLHVSNFTCHYHHKVNHKEWYFHKGPAFLNPIVSSNTVSMNNFCKQNHDTKDVLSELGNKTSLSSHVNESSHFQTLAENEVTKDQPENEVDLFENINYDEITGGDEEKLNEFKLLMLEVDVMRQDGMEVPSKMSTNEWKELFSLQSRNQRRKYLRFLFKTEMKKLSEKRKKELKRLARLEHEEEASDSSDHLTYGFRGSTIVLRVYDTTINAFDNYRLIRSMMFGHNLVIDCGFYNDMNSMENKLCCKQLVILFAENRLSKEPFNLHFCNLKKTSSLFKDLKKSIPTLEDPAFPINIYEDHYLDIFPKDKLVYLTPHCREELKEFNPDDIYIIGAIVDRVNQHPLTLAKAKSEGLRMASLPLDRYLDWAIGNKSLTINQVLRIMHDLQVTGDWNIAFKNVPQRKIRKPSGHDEPVKDHRKPWRRGTALQPPPRFIKRY